MGAINEAGKAGVPSPNIIANGVFEGTVYMIQEQLEGVNGSTCNQEKKGKIWETIGRYASMYHHIKDITIPALKEAEFHDNWGSKLEYNISQFFKNLPFAPAAPPNCAAASEERLGLLFSKILII